MKKTLVLSLIALLLVSSMAILGSKDIQEPKKETVLESYNRGVDEYLESLPKRTPIQIFIETGDDICLIGCD